MLNIKQILKNKLKRNKLKRRYIDNRLGVEGFFKALEKDGIKYCVLRWFETLPSVQENEDIDILVADNDISGIERYLLGTKKRGTPCDLYSSGGLTGTSYQGLAYYPEYLALEILNNTVTINGGIRVPSGKYHFLSMAFHAVYHKGYSSGVPSITGKSIDSDKAEHDYPEVLTAIAEKVGIDLPDLTLERLDDLLGKRGWRSPMDMLEKLSARNEWIRDTYFSRELEDDPVLDGFSVFIVREKGLEYLELIRTQLESSGFDILYEELIKDEQKEISRRNLRGGNWNKGPWPVSGGSPAYIFAVHDYFPLKPNEKIVKKHPGLVNERLLNAKVKIRDLVNKNKPRREQCNILHSSDNPHQALEYLYTAIPSKQSEEIIIRQLKELYKQRKDYSPGIYTFTGHQRRAKVEMVWYNDIEAVRKIYRPGRERFLEREILARTIGSDLPEMTPFLETGDDYIIMPFYHDILKRDKMLPIRVLIRTREIIKYFRKQGYELIDFKPKNILFDEKEGLKIIDFEFFQKSFHGNNELRGNYCWYSVPDGFPGDIPVSRQKQKNNYYRYWFSYTGIPLFFAIRPLPVSVFFCVQLAGRTVLLLKKTIRNGKNFVRSILIRGKRLVFSIARKIIS